MFPFDKICFKFNGIFSFGKNILIREKIYFHSIISSGVVGPGRIGPKFGPKEVWLPSLFRCRSFFTAS